MPTFKIPVSWELFGIVEVEAESLDEAIEYFDKECDSIDFPSEANYIDGSFKRDDEEIIKDYN